MTTATISGNETGSTRPGNVGLLPSGDARTEAPTVTATPVELFLAEQARLTPVERLAGPGRGPVRDLVPLSAPAPGQQYAFEVSLDVCTGCKACVTACHNVNGLDDGESFRTVGLLTGGSPAQPFQQTVTAACHHCLDPACLAGCPTNAYEKDRLSGIVAHVEGRCLGCGYCTWTCPYEVPRYNRARGVVRKCDMCRDRLAAGEAPACVSACPNRAIRIAVVDADEVLARTQGHSLVPTAPPSELTRPATSYRSEFGLPDGLAAAGATLGGGARSHRPLVVMLVLTQASVGAFTLDLVAGLAPAGTLAVGLGLLGLIVSVLHLGRPERAWRSVAGLRHSWLSREVAAFSLFAAAAVLAVGTGSPVLRVGAVAAGAAGVGSSAMLYVVTKRPPWRAALTFARFGLGCAVGGAATTLAATGDRRAAGAVVVFVAAKLAWEAVFVWRSAPAGPDPGLALRAAAAVAAVVLALGGTPPATALALVAVLAGEAAERTRFFTGASWAGMPGPKG